MKSCRMLGIVLATSLVCLVSIGRADTTELVSNGEFNNQLSDWNNWNNGVTWLDAGSSTSPNGPSISYSSNAWFSTNPTTALVAGQTYRLSLYGTLLSSSASSSDADKTLYTKVALGATTYVELTPVLTNAWKQYSVDFTPTAAVSGYEIAMLNSIVNHDNHGGGVSPCVFGVDSVSLSAVPEPSAILLTVSGALGLIAYAWRKRQ